jgi:hypothetical protein
MNKLIQEIEEIRGKLEGFRRHKLSEPQTRTSVINPLLKSLGWDVGNPYEVEENSRTPDGKIPDYRLKINSKLVLVVEAKALDKSLDDDRDIGQVVGYAGNAGIDWCVLTNGVKWQVYRSFENCSAPERLLFAVSLDPQEALGKSAQQLAEQMWGFSRDGMANGTLDKWREPIFIDRKVIKAIEEIMTDQPTWFINRIKAAANDETLNNQKIRESISRILSERGVAPQRPIGSSPPGGTTMGPVQHIEGRSHNGKKPKGEYDRYRLRYNFWTLLLEKAKEKTKLHSSISPGEFGWIATGAGKRGLGFSYVIRQHEAQIDLYIDRAHRGQEAEQENKSIFDSLEKSKRAIEEAFGEPLEWQRLKGKRACRIRKTLTVGGYRDKVKWPEIHDAMIDAMIRLEKALRPHIDKLKI